MTEKDYAPRVALALEGLVPIAWLERCGRCADPQRPTVEELFPTEAEREAIVEVLVMADILACGDFGRRSSTATAKKPSSLAALAKAIVCLALVPGGVKFLGTAWRVESMEGGGVRLVNGEVQAPAKALHDPQTVESAVEAMRRAILDGLGEPS